MNDDKQNLNSTNENGSQGNQYQAAAQQQYAKPVSQQASGQYSQNSGQYSEQYNGQYANANQQTYNQGYSHSQYNQGYAKPQYTQPQAQNYGYQYGQAVNPNMVFNERNNLVYVPALVDMILNIVSAVFYLIMFFLLIISGDFINTVLSELEMDGIGIGGLISGLGSIVMLVSMGISIAKIFLDRWLMKNSRKPEKAKTIMVWAIIFTVLNAISLVFGANKLFALIYLAIWVCILIGSMQLQKKM